MNKFTFKSFVSFDYLAYYPYYCSEQKTSAIMPYVYTKKLYDSVWLKYDLREVFLETFEDNEYKKKSLDDTIKTYLSDIAKYQKDNWGFDIGKI